MDFKKKIAHYLFCRLEIIMQRFNEINICVSKNILSDYLYAGAKPEKLKLILPGIDYSIIQISEDDIAKIKKTVIGAESDKIKIACLFGAFDRLRNGYDVFMKIIETILKKYPDTPVKFAIYGSRRSEDLQIYISQKKLTEHITIIDNYFAPDDVISAIDIMVLPYRYCAFPVHILKAQKYFKPVIASDVGIMTEMIRDGENGYLLPVADYISFAEKINELCVNPELYGQLVDNIAGFPQKFRLSDMIDRHCSVYQKKIQK